MGALSIPYSQGDAADRSFAYPADSTNLPLLQTILLRGAQADTSPWVGLGLACHGAAATRTKTSCLFCAIKWKTSSCYFLFPPRKKSQFHRLKAHMTAHCMWTRLLCTCPGKADSHLSRWDDISLCTTVCFSLLGSFFPNAAVFCLFYLGNLCIFSMTRHKKVQLLKPLQKGKKYNSARSSCFESTDMTREEAPGSNKEVGTA